MIPIARSEIKWTAALLLAGFVLSFAAIKIFRANGHEPRFYQENFGPAVMMTCGYGFTAPPFGASPPSLFRFLRREQNTFACADLPTPMPTEVVSWNGTWYYLYAATSLVWRATGISWTALDGLAATFGAIVLTALYGLFRLLASRWVATMTAFFIMLTPAHLEQLPMLRDYSKAPFVLLSVLALAWLVMRTLSRRATITLAAGFGAIVGLGYGFRSDLIVMVPFGFVAILLFLPGGLRDHWPRNLGAATAALLAFLLAGYPPLQGQQAGGCQFHYSLLGLTSPLVREMNLSTPIYGFGDHFLDTFVDLKVGDHANRVSTVAVPNLCAPEYDAVSADLFARMVKTFPADLVAHAYGSVLTILRAGFTLPRLSRMFGDTPVLSVLVLPIDWVSYRVGMLGPLVTAAGVAAAWAVAPRLGLALAAFILFLAGYPAIEFEARHWFHLRFLPLWAAGAALAAWLAADPAARAAGIRRGGLAVAGMVIALIVALGAIRVVQHDSAAAVIDSYVSSPTEALAFADSGTSSRAVEWRPVDYAPPPGHRSSDMLVVTVTASGCGESGPVALRFRYEFDNPGHDMGSTMVVERGAPGDPPTRVFFPVFSQGHLDLTYLRFAGVETPGRPADCIAEIARFADRSALPLWIQAQAPPDWRERHLYQSFFVPGFLR